jgi:hypothetical protein
MDSNIKVGDHVLAKVGRNKVEVVVMGIADGRYKVGSLSTGRQFVTTNVEPKPAEAAPEPAPEPAAPAAASAEQPRRGGGRLSLVDAAAKVLEGARAPMGVREMFEEARRRRLWEPGAGKTPLQTLCSSIYREIKEKGSEARFRKAERGRFVYRR